MSNYEALKTATANPTKTHKLMENLHTLELGKDANVLLTSGNHLEDFTKLEQPTMVIMNGRVL
jgi:imidazolonepropionase-like amidohydrolase